jgi:hypothetical protein
VSPNRPARRRLTRLPLAAVAVFSLALAACTSAATPEPATPEAVSNIMEPTPEPVSNSERPLGTMPMEFGTKEDVGQMLAFLTGPVVYTDNSEKSVTAGKQLAVSYYSTPKYWGGYVCDATTFPGTDCAYTIKPGMDGDNWHQWPDPPDNAGANLAYERADATAGADIYDIATWQIALALVARDAANIPGADAAALNTLIENQNLHLTDPKYRATAANFKYGYTDSISEPSQAFYFRMTPTDFLVTDPLWTDEAYKGLITNAEDVTPEQMGQTSWTDWKPITGENAWAWFLGPIQADALRYEAQGYIPFSSTSLQNAVKVLDAFSRMQTAIGAFYYATGGSLGNVGPIPEGEISVENNFSALGGLRVLEAALQATKAKDASADKAAIDAALAKVGVMLNGGTTVGGYQTDGLLSYMFNGAYDPAKGFFVQGGTAYPASAPGNWVPASGSDPWAVDVNTWGLAALGPATADAWWGPGTAYRIWQNVRPWGGYFGPAGDKSGPIWGVGYSNQDNNAIMSTEWTAGAINMLYMLETYYTQHPESISPDDLSALQADLTSMLTNVQKLRADNYASAGFNDAVPAEFLAAPPQGQAYLYGSKRYAIPFGWFANPLPSTCSTSWPVMLHYNFNPFQPGGTFDAPALPKPAAKDISGGGGGNATPTPASGPLPADVAITVVNQVADSSIAVNYKTSLSGNYIKAADVPQNGTLPNVKLPKGTVLVSIAYNKPPGGSFWGAACDVKSPSVLANGSTLTAIWTASGSDPCQVSGGGGGATPTPASGPLTSDIAITVVNQVADSSIAVNYKTSPSGNYIKAADVPQNGTLPNVKLPKGTVLVSIAYNKPPGGSFWGAACDVKNPSSLSNGSTLTAIWTPSGSDPCK